jgi:hypothetical protein
LIATDDNSGLTQSFSASADLWNVCGNLQFGVLKLFYMYICIYKSYAHVLIKERQREQGTVAPTYNPSYSGEPQFKGSLGK